MLSSALRLLSVVSMYVTGTALAASTTTAGPGAPHMTSAFSITEAGGVEVGGVEVELTAAWMTSMGTGTCTWEMDRGIFEAAEVPLTVIVGGWCGGC